MRSFRRSTTHPVDAMAAEIEVLVFECAEIRASNQMREILADCCELLGVKMDTIDVWVDPDAVRRHRLLIAPAVIVRADGVEVDRLVGPRSCRQVRRFVARTLGLPTPASLIVA